MMVKAPIDERPDFTFDAMYRPALMALAAQHPKAAIRITRGYFDGSQGKEFGYVPNDWDGTVMIYELRMRP
jgi:hypothetical protein